MGEDEAHLGSWTRPLESWRHRLDEDQNLVRNFQLSIEGPGVWKECNRAEKLVRRLVWEAKSFASTKIVSSFEFMFQKNSELRGFVRDAVFVSGLTAQRVREVLRERVVDKSRELSPRLKEKSRAREDYILQTDQLEGARKYLKTSLKHLAEELEKAEQAGEQKDDEAAE